MLVFEIKQDYLETFVKFVRTTIVFLKQAQK